VDPIGNSTAELKFLNIPSMFEDALKAQLARALPQTPVGSYLRSAARLLLDSGREEGNRIRTGEKRIGINWEGL